MTQQARPQKQTTPASVAEQADLDRVGGALEKRRCGQRLTAGDVAAVRRYERRRATEQRQAAYRAVPQTELVPMLATTRKTVLEWESEGLPTDRDTKPITYDLFKVLPWLKNRWLMGGEPGSMTKRTAEIDLLVARKVHLELKTRLASGELLNRADVERGRCERITMVRAGLEALRRALAPAVLELGEDASLDDADSMIWDYVRPLLEAFATKATSKKRSVQIQFPKQRKEVGGGR